MKYKEQLFVILCVTSKAVRHQLKYFGKALLIDGHSFSETMLPYEPKVNHQLYRPDICLGTDPVFTPDALLCAAKEYFTKAGLGVAFKRR